MVTPGAPGRDSSEDSVRKTTGDHLLFMLSWVFCVFLTHEGGPKKDLQSLPGENSKCLLGKSMNSWLFGEAREPNFETDSN